MKKRIVMFFLLFIPVFLFAQEYTTVQYFKDKSKKKESVQEKANYKMVTTVRDTTALVEFFEIKTNRVLLHLTYCKNKPYGTWYFVNDKALATDSIVYGKIKPPDFYAYDLKTQLLNEDVEGEFIHPELTETDERITSVMKQHKCSEIAAWIAVYINYPIEAQRNNIQGEVQTQFTIGEKGEIGDIRVTEGVHLLIDIEAFRVLKSLPTMKPATLDGKPIKLYVEAPINFLLRYH